ncbi:MAG: acetyltransferase [Flavobacterium sp.]|jgi:sugar O-acyltransferase (sialic acid O-acetyltransferase NeuD family)|nr:acetyltransferase [Flavobacterium sp.]
MKKIVIVGAGGFGREVKIIIDDINKENFEYKFLGFYDDNIDKDLIVNGFPILGTINDLNNLEEDTFVAFGIGEPKTKMNLVKLLNNKNLKFPTLIHPSSIISADEVSIGKGTIICAGNIITCNIQIKDFVTINLMCTVGHDTVIKDYCSFMPSVNISGEVEVQECVYVGTGAKIINRLQIGKNTIVGAGAVVSKSLPENCTAVGIPAKPIKFHEND